MDNVKTIQPLQKGLSGEILIPGDKSVSHRSVMFAGLCDSEVKITNFLHAADCMSTVNCMRSLGVNVQEIDENIYPKSQLHRISLGKSYGRISNKSFVLDLSEEFGLDFSKQQCYKLKATYDIVHTMMIIQL